MTVGIPNELELELGRQYAHLARQQSPADDLDAILANALAQHRARCTAAVEAILYSVEMDCLTDEALDAFSRGWTPEQVRRLVAAYRSLRHHVDEAAKLIPQVLSGARAR